MQKVLSYDEQPCRKHKVVIMIMVITKQTHFTNFLIHHFCSKTSNMR